MTTMIMRTTTKKVNAMTTELPHKSESEPKRRAKHPAMAARILTTGLAVSTTLGLTSLYGIAARAATLEPNPVEPNTVAPLTTQPLTAAAPPVAAMPPAASALSAPSPASTQAPTVSAAPVVVAVPVPAWNPPRTSGSK